MKGRLRILFLEDVPSDVPVIQHELRKAGLLAQVHRVDTKEAFAEELEKHPPDIILSDHGLPSFDGFAALALAKRKHPLVPFIFVTSTGGETITKAFQQGATDYVLKSQLAKLAPAVKRALREAIQKRDRARRFPDDENSLRFLIQNVKDYAIMRLDPNGIITFWSAGAVALFGFSPAEVVGHHFSMLYEETVVAAHFESALQTANAKGFFEEESSRLRKHQRPIYTRATLRPLRLEDGTLQGFVHVSHRVGDPVPILRSIPTTDARYTHLVELCPCAIMVVSTTGQILYANSAAATLLKARSGKELTAYTLQDIAPPSGGKNILERIRDARQQGHSFVEHDLRRLDDTAVPVEVSASSVTYLGHPRLEIVAHDITEQRRAEQALRQREQHVHAILETALDAIVTVDRQGLVQEWNPAAERIFGYRRSEALGHPVDELVIPESLRKTYREGLENYLKTGTCRLLGHPVELTLRRATNEEFQVELAISRSGTDEAPACTALIRDITERKQSEAALQKSEEYFRMLVEGAKDYAMYMLDAEGRVVGWNAGAERLEGYKAEEIEGKHYSVFFLPEDIRAGLPGIILKRAAAEGRLWNEGWRIRGDGSRFWSRGVVTALRDEHGTLQGFSKIAHDRTQQRMHEQEILRLNTTLEQRVAERTAQLEAANHELEAFSYSVSHDLRSPLRHITGYIEILRSEISKDLDKTALQHLQTIAQSASRMGELIDALLAFSRMGQSEMHQTDVRLDLLVEQARRELAQDAANRNIEWQIDPLPIVHGDAFLLRQAIVNLLSNALKYTRDRNPARIAIGAQIFEEEIQVFFRDNGVGFDPQYADKLWGVFQRLHHAHQFEGTGIGLANVRRIIHRHGGRTWAEGKPDEGATFYFSLPQPPKSGLNAGITIAEREQ
ncbi:MAG TPA: PAS domain S-box protein [Verrucomicrobiae bacterium]|nr:PAS domain S-box protein [Verrucomicrobiae bacterium]